MKVAVVGLGYVGAVTAACLAHEGHDVVGVDPDVHKVELLARGRSPILEPRLQDLVAEGRASNRLSVTTDPTGVASTASLSIVCVGTPSRSDGTVDLQYLERVSSELGTELAQAAGFSAVLFRSTVPPGTVESLLLPILEDASGRRADVDFGIAMCPEFLREGSGVDDFFHPPFTVVGVRDDQTLALAKELFSPLGGAIHSMPIRSAEALKYACNAFHAVKVTFANEIGRLLRSAGADSREVMRVFVEDDQLNVSGAYLRPGFAFGGSCLPKDLRALLHIARVLNVDLPMLAAVMPSNESHVRRIVWRVLDTGTRNVAMLGLSFKPETDDLRESPYVELAETLLGKGLQLRIYDPNVNPERLIGTNRRYIERHLPHLDNILASTPEGALTGAEVAVIGTGADEVRRALVRFRPKVVVDLVGGLGAEVEAMPGYEGAAW